MVDFLKFLQIFKTLKQIKVNIFKNLTKMIEYLLLPFVEIEIRLGTLSKTFDSSIDKKYFNIIKEDLLKSKEYFENIEVKNTTEYIKGGVKLINDSSLQMKENIINKTISLQNSPFDVRLSINQEFSLKSYISSFSKNDTILRKKERTSFIDRNSRYDLTVVHETINNITKQKYEIEIELLVNKTTLMWSKEYLNDFLECKIYDLINIVEPIEREKFKISF